MGKTLFVRKILRYFCVFIFIIVQFFSFSSSAQEVGEGEGGSEGPRAQLAMIIFSGLGGAILGLSTLSFYDRPQDELVNIGLGAAFGVIAGTIFVTFKAATKPYEYNETTSLYWNRSQRGVIDQYSISSAPMVNLNWSF